MPGIRFCWENSQPAVCKTNHEVMQSACKQCGSSMTDEDNETANQDGEEIVRFQGVLHIITSLYSVNNDVEIEEM